MDFNETAEHGMLREAVRKIGLDFGHEYYVEKSKTDGRMGELWSAVAQAGFMGVNIPEEYGGGGGGIGDVAAVCEELAAQGCPLLMMVVSPAICGTVIAKFGTAGQKERWLPGLADGSTIMAFAITEPDAGSNSHNVSTVAQSCDIAYLKPARLGDRLTATTFIQRVNTTGGLAPTKGCNASNLGEARNVPYTSDYYFYRAAGSN